MYQRYEWTKIGKDRNSILRNYEPIQPYILIELAKEIAAEIFIDVGANIGAYSVFMSSLGCISKIYSFEADPNTFGELKNNVQLNDHSSKAEIFNTAISDRKEQMRFGIVNDYSGANSIIGTSIHSTEKFTKEILIDCVPLDSIIAEKSRKICMKVDVEGHEKEVITGAKNVLSNNKVIVQLENYDDDPTVKNLLSSYGYRQIFSMGPDMYFTNIDENLNPEIVIKVFERSVAELIKSNFDSPAPDTGHPIKARLFFGIAVEISGPPARMARRLRDRLRAH